jgi:ribosomal protein S18 acetylase RimI-like enzyme
MATLKSDTRSSFQAETVLRLATQDDLPKLEWYGQYTHFRRLFSRTFEDQQQGRRLMLVADFNGFPVGQVFVQLGDAGLPTPSRQWYGYLYSLRVLELFRGCGLGTRLIIEAEGRLRELEYRRVIIAVAKTNTGARRLYERLGYVVYTEDSGRWHYIDHVGQMKEVVEPSWLLKKKL